VPWLWCVAVEASPLLSVWDTMTVALFFCVATVGVAFGLLIGFLIGAVSARKPRTGPATTRLAAIDQMMRVSEYLKAGAFGSAARELGITDQQADAWTFEQLQSHLVVRLQAVVKKATG
jgi:hypothetical protein